MPLFLDRHEFVKPITAEEAAELHVCDIDVGQHHNVNWLTYWYYTGASTGFCLADAPSKEAVETVHREAHGVMPTQVIEVDWGTLEAFLGRVRVVERGEVWEAAAFRTMVCTQVSYGAGVAAGYELQKHRQSIGRRTISARGGRQIAAERAIIGCFPSTIAALESALAMQQAFGPIALMYQAETVNVRIGIASGDPVFMRPGIFQAALDAATSLSESARPGEILVSSSVYSLCRDRGFVFEPSDLPKSLAVDRVYKLRSRADSQYEALGEIQLTAEHLSPREFEVLRLIVAGKTNQEIADRLVISHSTVATHVRSILEKTSCSNRAEATAHALRKGLV